MFTSVRFKISGILFLVLFTELVYARTYYFSSVSGDDAHTQNQAQDQRTPWRSLDKLNSLSILQPGDSVLFHRGELFFGTIKINNSGSKNKPIVYSAYDSGRDPIITSLVNLKGWIDVGNGIYEVYHDLFGKNVNIVLVNSIVHEQGRYPNRDAGNNGYLKLESHTGNSSILDNELPAIPNWTNGEVVIRKNHWIIDRQKITNHSGSRISYDKGNSNYDPADGFGYFIQNHIKTLDQFGEWYYNPTTKKLSIYFGNSNPQSIKVEVAVNDNLIYSPQRSDVDMYIVFDHLTLKGANRNSIQFNSGNHFAIQNCSVEFSGESGIQADGVSDLKVTNCLVSKSNNNGIVSIYNNQNTIIESNKIDSTHMFPGMGQSGDGNGIGLYCIGKNSLIQKNRITNTGYSAVYFGGDSVQIKNNLIDRFCLVKDDGSGIYTFTGSENKSFFGRKITGNIVLNGMGAIYGADSDYSPAEGIYLDDNASGILVSDNTVGNMTNYGVYLHNSRDIILRNNTVYNCNSQLILRHDLYGQPVRNIRIYNNVFFSKQASQKLSVITTVKNDLTEMAVLDSNFYDRPVYNDGVYISTQYNDNNGLQTSRDYDLTSWKSEVKQDLVSQKSIATVPEYQIQKLLGRNKFANGNFDMSINGIESYSPTNKIKTTWMNDNNSNGVLQVISGDLSYLIIPVGAIDNKKKYILKFKQVANKASLINVYVRQYNAPYQTISKSKSFKTSLDKKEFELLLDASEIEENSCIILESKDKDLLYRLDNILFSEAEIDLPDTNDYIKFLYNDSFQKKSFQLSGAYYDARNSTHTGELVLEPYTSVVLIKKTGMIIPDAPLLKADDNLNTLLASHILGNSEILVSENNAPFINYYEQINVGNVYREAGYWKFKVREGDGRLESAVVESPQFNNITSTENALKIYPNPVISEAKFYISNTETGLCTISIYSLKGYKMYELKVVKSTEALNANLNIRHLNPGMYLVLVRINGKSFLNKIVKI